MRATQANGRLLLAGITHKQIAAMANVSLKDVSYAVANGYCVMGGNIWRARVVICKALAVEMDELWPPKKQEPAVIPTSE